MRNPNHVTLRLFFVAMCAIAPLTILANTPITDALRVSLVVSVQICAGSFLWRLLRGTSIPTIPELLGIGMSLGTFLSLVSSQLLRATPLAEIGWIFPGVFLSIAFGITKFRPNPVTPSVEDTPQGFALLISISLPVSLTYWWWWLWPIALIPALTYLLWFRRPNQKYTFATSALLLISNFGLIFYATKLRNLNLSWWIFSNDQVFSESLSTSLSVWGPNENIQLVGGSIHYHWFALAWAGMTTRAAGIGPWTVVTKVIPICAMLGAICLIWAATVSLSKNRFAPAISVAFFALASNSFALTPTRYFHSPTYLFSIIWALGFTFVLIVRLNSRVFIAPIVLGILFAASFGGKATNGPVEIAGVVLVLLYAIISNRNKHQFRFLTETLAWIIIAGLIVYKMEYKSSFSDVAARANNLVFGFGEIGAHLGIANWDSSSLVRSIAFVAVIAGLVSNIVPISLLLLNIETRRRSEVFYFIGITLSSFFCISIFTHGGAAQLFFLLVGLSILPIGVGWGLAESWSSIGLTTKKREVGLAILLGFFGTLVSMQLWNLRLSGFDPYKSGFILKWISQFVVWGMATFVLIFLHKLTKRGPSAINNATRYYLAIVVLMSSSFSFGIVQRIENAIRLKNLNGSIEQSTDTISGSKDLVVALTWLRNNSNQDDIVATNRYCIPKVEPCSPRWFLVSAISRRRMLIEGGYAFNLSEDREERRKFSIQFAENGDMESANWLKKNRVRWVFVDYSAQESGKRSWEPFGLVVFRNAGASIVQLK